MTTAQSTEWRDSLSSPVVRRTGSAGGYEILVARLWLSAGLEIPVVERAPIGNSTESFILPDFWRYFCKYLCLALSEAAAVCPTRHLRESKLNVVVFPATHGADFETPRWLIED